jgi:hypothetical protein
MFAPSEILADCLVGGGSRMKIEFSWNKQRVKARANPPGGRAKTFEPGFTPRIF